MAYRDYVSPEVLEPVIWESIVAIENQAAHLAPVDTGYLRDSLSFATNKRKGSESASTFLGAGAKEIEPPSSDYVGAVGTTAEYGAAVEFGRPDMQNYPAQPFLRPALDWFRHKVGIIGGRELKVQLAAYNIRHPHKVKEYLAK